MGVPPTETHVFSCFTKPFCYFPLRQSKPYDILVISSAQRSTFLSIVYKFDEPKPSELNQSSFVVSLSVFKKFSLVLKNGPRTPIWANHGHQLGSVLRRWIDRWPRGARSQLLEPPGSRAAVREEGLHHAENCNLEFALFFMFEGHVESRSGKASIHNEAMRFIQVVISCAEKVL